LLEEEEEVVVVADLEEDHRPQRNYYCYRQIPLMMDNSSYHPNTKRYVPQPC
jgi:hypothetical protein